MQGSTNTPTTRSASAAAAAAAASSTGASAAQQQHPPSAPMAQLLDEEDHTRCSEGNQRALLADNLDQLRGLVKVLEADDWKYQKTTTSHQNAVMMGGKLTSGNMESATRY